MSRVPAGLCYLTIYNPTLKPSETAARLDEDAEEESQILFYSSKERAVSRDKMLRQVGLAKALVNFSQMFGSTVPCYNVHSQSRRMIMANVEGSFWIHAAVDLAKSPRASNRDANAKIKSKKGKEPERDVPEQPVYDFHDGSLYDLTLREHLLRGYEQFKVTHGSFTTILSALGQEALELQLERFFTIWAWSWDIASPSHLNTDLGVPLHPSHNSIRSILDTQLSVIPKGLSLIYLCPPHVTCSTKFEEHGYPAALLRYLITRFPSKPPSNQGVSRRASTSTLKSVVGLTTEGQNAFKEAVPSGFLGMPPMNMNMNMNLKVMDPRQWTLPGYLSFGKGSRSSTLKQDVSDEKTAAQLKERRSDSVPTTDDASSEVDTAALEDAISSDQVSISQLSRHSSEGKPKSASEQIHDAPDGDESGTQRMGAEVAPSVEPPPTLPAIPLTPSIFPSLTGREVPEAIASDPLPDASGMNAGTAGGPAEDDTSETSSNAEEEGMSEFKSLQVHIAEHQDALTTTHRRVLYIQKHDHMIALVGPSVDNDDYDAAFLRQSVRQLFRDIEGALDDDNHGLDASIPSASKILQPKDKHFVKTGIYSLSSEKFAFVSEHLYNAKQYLDREPNIREVFSRGQSPQHWHVSKRATGIEGLKGSGGEVFLDVSRKEASLADVDHVLQRLHKFEA